MNLNTGEVSIHVSPTKRATMHAVTERAVQRMMSYYLTQLACGQVPQKQGVRCVCYKVAILPQHLNTLHLVRTEVEELVSY